MKKYILSAMILLSMKGFAQEDKMNISVYENQKQKVEVKMGTRFIGDAALLNSDFTPLNSGAKISDARIRAKVTYGKWDMYVDFDFAKGKFTQKNIYGRYTFSKDENNFSNLKFGYAVDPFSMNANTSQATTHFIARPAYVYAFNHYRKLGFTYMWGNKRVFTHTGLYSENQYNNQEAGNQGFTFAGRYLGYLSKTDDLTVGIGASLKYTKLGTGKIDKNEVLERELHVSAPLENIVDARRQFTEMKLPWASDVLAYGFEGLISYKKFFARGEYAFSTVSKDRPDQELFDAQLGGLWAWTTLESWQKANPIGDTKYNGGYIELGYLILGDKYSYNSSTATLKGLNKAGMLEVVARISHTNLNDIKEGDYYLRGRNQFYPGGKVIDYPNASLSVAGGETMAYTLGVNYAITPYTQVMVGYTAQTLDNVFYTMDKNFSYLESRLIITF